MRYLLFIIQLFVLQLHSQVQLKGGLLQVEGASQYCSIEIHLLVDWPVVGTKTSTSVDWGDGNPIQNLPITQTYSNSGNITNGCSSGVMIFTGSHTYSSAGTYTISVVDSFFVQGITNMPNSSQQKLRISEIITTDHPTFINQPIKITESGGNLDFGRSCSMEWYSSSCFCDDPDWDSTAASIVTHPEIPGYTLPPGVILLAWGSLSLTPNIPPGKYNVYWKVEEWRKRPPLAPLFLGANYREAYFEVDNCAQVKEESRAIDFVKLFPNPVSDNLKIEVQNSPSKFTLSIRNTIGELYFINNEFSSQDNIDVSSWPPGVYLLSICNQNQRSVGKFIKQ